MMNVMATKVDAVTIPFAVANSSYNVYGYIKIIPSS